MRHSLPRVIELELWSRPGSNLAPEAGKAVIAPQCRAELALCAEVVLGLSAIPHPIDSQNLAAAFGEGELTHEAFEGYCARNGLVADAHSPETAACFLEYEFGRPLAWVHLDASTRGIGIGRRINAWAHAQGFCLVEPAETSCILQSSSLSHLLPDDA